MYNNSDPTIKIYANLTDPKKGCGQAVLWHYIRFLDPSGSGFVRASLTELAKALGKSIPTIKRYLREGKAEFFRHIALKGDLLTVYYHSLDRVMIAKGFNSLGVIVDIPLSGLRHIKVLVTQAIAQHLQAASRRLVKKATGRTPLDAENILPSSLYGTSQEAELRTCGAMGLIHQSSRYSYVGRYFQMFGVSQNRIAEYGSRSTRTVQRRLDNSYRSKRSIPTIQKTQLAQFVQKCDRKSFSELKDETMDLSLYFWSAGAMFEVGTNIYGNELVLRRCRAKRLFFKRRLAQVLLYP